VFSRCNRPARLRVAVPGINRPGSLTTNFQPTKDESLEAIIEFRTLFLSFIGLIQNKNLEKTPKCDSSSQETLTSQLGGSIGVAKFAKSSSKS